MNMFWIIATGLTGLALLFVLIPLLRKPANLAVAPDANEVNLTLFRLQLAELDVDRAAGNLDASEYAAARCDLEQELLRDIQTTPPSTLRSGRWAAALLTLAVPLCALGLYLAVGDPAAISRDNSNDSEPPNAQDLAAMESLVESLAARLQTTPDNLDGWIMLGRSYLTLEKPAEAIKAYEQAVRLAPENAEAVLGQAEALAHAQGTLQGPPAALIAQVLEREPNHPNALWLRGLLEYQSGKPSEAVVFWNRLADQLPSDGPDLATLRRYIEEARQATDSAVPINTETATPITAEKPAVP